jgi:TnpA family transposase
MRMIPGLSEAKLTLMMRALEEEERLHEANVSVVQFKRRHRLVERWGDAGLASSDMMTLEATRRLWNARIDPRSGNYAIGPVRSSGRRSIPKALRRRSPGRLDGD